MEGGPDTQDTPSERQGGRHDTNVLTPEEVARNFLRLRGGAIHDPRTQPSRRPRRNTRSAAATIAVVIVAVAVLAGLAVLTLSPNKQARPPAAQARLHNPAAGAATTSPSTTTIVPLLAPSAVTIDVLNAYGSGRVASVTAASLKQRGFTIGVVANAPGNLPAGQPSQILYSPDASAAANTLAQTLLGPVTETPTTALSGNHLQLWVANPQLTVKTS
jgi:hypothetical protein